MFANDIIQIFLSVHQQLFTGMKLDENDPISDGNCNNVKNINLYKLQCLINNVRLAFSIGGTSIAVYI
jgi:hypothetical protein